MKHTHQRNPSSSHVKKPSNLLADTHLFQLYGLDSLSVIAERLGAIEKRPLNQESTDNATT